MTVGIERVAETVALAAFTPMHARHRLGTYVDDAHVVELHEDADGQRIALRCQVGVELGTPGPVVATYQPRGIDDERQLRDCVTEWLDAALAAHKRLEEAL